MQKGTFHVVYVEDLNVRFYLSNKKLGMMANNAIKFDLRYYFLVGWWLGLGGTLECVSAVTFNLYS